MKPPKLRARYPQVLTLLLIFYDCWACKGKLRAKANGVSAPSEKMHLSEMAALLPTWLCSGAHPKGPVPWGARHWPSIRPAWRRESPEHGLPRALSEAVNRAPTHCSKTANQLSLQNLFRKSKFSRLIIKPPKTGRFYQEGTT